MKVSSLMVDETLETMKKYQTEHYGVPNGPDYPEVAAAIAGSEKAMLNVIISSMIVGMSGQEIASAAKGVDSLPAEEKTRGLCAAISKSGCFQPFAEAMYLGYLLGKRSHEIEKLEQL